jgi:hypothetical protein
MPEGAWRCGTSTTSNPVVWIPRTCYCSAMLVNMIQASRCGLWALTLASLSCWSGALAVPDEDGIPRHGTFRHRYRRVKPLAISFPMFAFLIGCIHQPFPPSSFDCACLRMVPASMFFRSDDLPAMPCLVASVRRQVHCVLLLAVLLIATRVASSSCPSTEKRIVF